MQVASKQGFKSRLGTTLDVLPQQRPAVHVSREHIGSSPIYSLNRQKGTSVSCLFWWIRIWSRQSLPAAKTRPVAKVSMLDPPFSKGRAGAESAYPLLWNFRASLPLSSHYRARFRHGRHTRITRRGRTGIPAGLLEKARRTRHRSPSGQSSPALRRLPAIQNQGLNK